MFKTEKWECELMVNKKTVEGNALENITGVTEHLEWCSELYSDIIKK